MRQSIDVVDAVVDEVDLPAAIDLAQDHLADQRSLCRVTNVRIGRRACGAVSMMLMSRIPASDMCSVRGIGVALMVSTSTSVRSCLRNSFWRTPKRCSSSMTTKPEILEPHVVLDQTVRADHDVDGPICETLNDPPLLGFAAQPRQHFDPDRECRQTLLKRS